MELKSFDWLCKFQSKKIELVARPIPHIISWIFLIPFADFSMSFFIIKLFWYPENANIHARVCSVLVTCRYQKAIVVLVDKPLNNP